MRHISGSDPKSPYNLMTTQTLEEIGKPTMNGYCFHSYHADIEGLGCNVFRVYQKCDPLLFEKWNRLFYPPGLRPALQAYFLGKFL